MPRGRTPEGENVLTNAERQARYRARRQALHPPVTITHRPATDRRSRPWRWRAAVAELLALQAEYAAWCNALPDSLRDSAAFTQIVALQPIIGQAGEPAPSGADHGNRACDRCCRPR